MNRVLKIVLVCAAALLPVITQAQLSLEAFTPSGGGGTSSGGGFSVNGQIGQTATPISTGGGYTVETSSLGFLVVPDACLSITLSNGSAVISWPTYLAEWTLEVGTGPNPDSASWSPVSPPYPAGETHYIFSDPISAQAKFYRLRREQ